VILAHVPGGGDPFDSCALAKPARVELLPISYRLAWPLASVHSSRLFFTRLTAAVDWSTIGAVFTRHLKLARAFLERFPRLPLVYEAHEVFTDTAPERRRGEIAGLEALVADRAAAIVANSRATARRLADRHRVRNNVEVIPNGVEYPSAVPDRDWTNARQHVVYAGSFFGWKGVDDLVAAAGELPGYRVRMVGGDDASIQRLRGGATAAGAVLEFTGRVPHAQVAGELANACIAVLPNRADTDSTFTSPIKLFEYMAAGCAVVATDIPALREVLDETDAAWAPPGNSRALARAIRSLADAPATASEMAARVREKARRYTWDARGERLAGVVKPLLGRR
jgi:glycosyltransferase involved in cell wall biosynthesis